MALTPIALIAPLSRPGRLFPWQPVSFWRAGVPLVLSFVGGWGAALPEGAIAQIVPDQTLPNPSHVSTPQPNAIDITGGTQTGGNLFHSFQSFTVPDATTASFVVPTDVLRVLARVSSGEPATVNGTLRAGGTADLFLLAPGGVFFGPNAQLDVGGSFVASTADQMTFADGTVFAAIAQDRQPPLLTATVPMGLQFGQASSQGQGILVRGNGRPDLVQTEAVDGALQAAAGQTFGLLGSSVTLQGGRIGAVGGQATLAAVGEGGEVTLAPNDLGWTMDNLTGPQGTIALDGLADVDVSGPGGGAVQVKAENLTLRGRSRIVADTFGALDGRGMNLTVNNLQVFDGSYISSSTFGDGRAGNFEVTAQTIDMTGPGPLQNVLEVLLQQDVQNPIQFSGGLFAMSFGSGDGGEMTVTAERATLRNSAFLATSPFGTGRGGVLNVAITGQLLLNGGQFIVDSFGPGEAGNAFVTAGNIRMAGGGGIFASSFDAGDAGLLEIQARESIEITGATSDGVFISGIAANSVGSGRGGNIAITSPIIRLSDGVAVGAVNFGSGSGGSVTVRASELLELRGSGGVELTNINTRTQGAGPAGNVLVEAGRLVLADGGTIFTSTLSSGAAGSLTVIADVIEVSGQSPNGFPSGLRSDASRDATLEGAAEVVTEDGLLDPNRTNLGAAGNIDVVANTITLRNGSAIVVSNEEGGPQAGDLRLTSERLTLESASTIRAEPSTGTGGNLFLNADHIQLRDQSLISTNASGESTGGNIFIDGATLVALDNSDITANAIAGRGGQVSLSTQGIFGTELRSQPTSQSDITASSELGTEFSGTVSITTPELDPSSSAVELPERVVDASSQVMAACAAASGNSFVAIGRGGKPTDPTRFVSANTSWRDLRDWTQAVGGDRLATPPVQHQQPQPNSSRPNQIQEATGWQIAPDGPTQLVAHNGSIPDIGDINCLEQTGGVALAH